VATPPPILELWSAKGAALGPRWALHSFPFRIGRSSAAHLQLEAQQVSKLHASITRGEEGAFYLTDLGSRNGTFLNDLGIGDPVRLTDGDIIRLGRQRLRFVLDADRVRTRRKSATTLPDDDEETIGLSQFLEALSGRGLRSVFQPVFTFEGECVGYEALTRLGEEKESGFPSTLFDTAHRYDRAAELSRSLRNLAATCALALPPRPALLFVNVHPEEMGSLADDFEAYVSRVPPHLRVVFEVHESAVVGDLGALRALQRRAHAHGLRLAYDDVGAGRSRLREMGEAPPDFVKLDRSLVMGIHESASRQQLLRGLLQALGQLSVKVVAEGIEHREEWDMCRQLGFDLAQGYLLGRPTEPGEVEP
jgi:EAL domain-containing protein (putative c-di-GMP-specific phosphodiesterase class I)